jgi:SAM-dependent methyltransferase
MTSWDALAGDPERRDVRVASTYDAVASSYADHLVGELDGKPFDRWLLRRIAADAGGLPVADAGCGPGHVTRFLADCGAHAVGFDLSPGMVAEARGRFPGMSFEQGDLTRLPRPADAEGWGAIVAWYSLVHLAGSEIPGAVFALADVLAPGGRLAVGLHAGREVVHRREWWGHDIDITFVQHDPDVVRGAFAAAGLVEVEWYLRGPYAGAEVETQRLYVVATKP